MAAQGLQQAAAAARLVQLLFGAGAQLKNNALPV